MREIVLGNGTMLLNFDRDLNIRDLYWPYGGFDNHGDGNRSNFGVFADERFVWFFSPEWEKAISYLPDTPVTDVQAVNHGLGLELRINDALHWCDDLFIKKIVVRNLRDYSRTVKFIFYQDLSIRGIEAGDSAVYDPQTGGIYHYKKGCYILANCWSALGGAEDYSAGVKRYRGREGTHRDAEDGYLSLNPVADGPVDSALGISVHLPAGGQDEVFYWLLAGHTLHDIRVMNRRLLERKPQDWLEDIVRHYRTWIRKAERDFADLTREHAELYKHSLFTIRSQINRKGAVVASPDADNFLVARDHYMYLWPRDGAMVAHALDLAGYPEEARRIYTFCSGVIGDEGYYLQRYNTDGTPGCTWHPMILDGQVIPPIQEDETALVIWALGRHWNMYGDEDLVRECYCRMIKPALHFMVDYVDPVHGLPRPSWDLWEERRGIFSFTCGAVYGALEAGAEMAEVMEDREMSQKCRTAARSMREGMVLHLYHPGMGRFLRGVYPGQDGLEPDFTLDSSMYGLWAFGAFAPNDQRIELTMEAVRDGLWAKTSVGGVGRYTGDYYHRVTDDVGQVPGNPWILTTLWLADWYIAKGLDDDLNKARELIDWAVHRATPGLLLPEQVHPYTGEPLSVCPLAWSHSTFIKVVVEYLQRRSLNGLH